MIGKILSWEKVGEFPYNLDPEKADLSDFKNINDSKTSLAMVDNLDFDEAWSRFKELVTEAIKFCKARNISEPMEMSVEERLEFLKESGIMPYLVTVSLKIGEAHKYLSRLFYLMEQGFKAIQSRFEAYEKGIVRK